MVAASVASKRRCEQELSLTWDMAHSQTQRATRVRNDGRRGRVANVAGVHGTYVHTCPAHIFPLSGLLSVALR